MKKLIVVFSLLISVGAYAQKADSAKKEVRISTGNSYSSLPPLVIVDGKKYKGDIKDMNANDIESMEVLKDASSKKLYGEAAKNGVILVTTKQGKALALKRSQTITTKADSASMKPLYIIDDKPSTGIQNLDPNDIDSISVVKDASEEAQNTAAGKNGVVIVITKAYKKKKEAEKAVKQNDQKN
jgi:TonB-dependent SusC/RagA subfamily outer membrane receptor